MLKKTYENIDSIGRAILSIKAKGVHNKELAEVIYPDGKKALAQVIALEGDQVTLQLSAVASGSLPIVKSVFSEGRFRWDFRKKC